MHQRQDPHGVSVDLVDQAIALVRDQLTGAVDPPSLAQHRMVSEPCCRITDDFIHLDGRVRVVTRNVVPSVDAVLQRLRRP